MTDLMRKNAQPALDTIRLKPTRGIPSFRFHVLKHAYIERIQCYRKHGRGG